MGCNRLSVLLLDIYLFFILFLYRVSLDPIGQNEACGAPVTRPGDVPRLAVPPVHDYRSLNSGNNLLFTVYTLSTNVYSVLHSCARLAFKGRL